MHLDEREKPVYGHGGKESNDLKLQEHNLGLEAVGGAKVQRSSCAERTKISLSRTSGRTKGFCWNQSK